MRLFRKCLIVIVGACVGLGAAGCGPPVPPERVNAVLPRNLPIYREEAGACDEADTVVLAQCIQIQEYAETVRGDWERHWEMAQWRVVRVERGRWPDASVDFICYHRWPTLESGIVLGAPPPVYYRGALLAFCIDTSLRKPTIVAHEQRSRIPPHGKPRRPSRDFYVHRQERRVYQQIMAAADQFFQSNQRSWGMREVVEEYDDFYVVEARNALGSEVVTVEKGSYRVRPVEPAYSDGQPSPSQSQP